MWNLKLENPMDRGAMEAVDWWLPRPESWGRWGNAGQKAQTSSYKVNKCWGSKAQDGGCS